MKSALRSQVAVASRRRPCQARLAPIFPLRLPMLLPPRCPKPALKLTASSMPCAAPFVSPASPTPPSKGSKHRVVPLPQALEDHIKEYLAKAREKHLRDLAIGLGETHIPEALARKYPRAASEWAWQYIFASANVCAHPRTGHIARHHLHEHSLQRQFKEADRRSPPRSMHILWSQDFGRHRRNIWRLLRAVPQSPQRNATSRFPTNKAIIFRQVYRFLDPDRDCCVICRRHSTGIQASPRQS
jgi:hypothetical protein